MHRRTGILARLSPYERRHLVAHLVAAGELDRMHDLLALEESGTAARALASDAPPASRSAGRQRPWRPLVKELDRRPGRGRGPITAAITNAWWLMSEAAGDPEPYLLDVRTAGQAAADDAATVLARGDPAPGVGHQFGYGLILDSLSSRIQFIPPALVRRLLGLGRWTTEQALAYALRLPDPQDRSATLVEVLPLLPQADQDRIEAQIVTSVRQIPYAASRVRAMITAAGRLSPAWQQQLLHEAADQVRSGIDIYDAEYLARISALLDAGPAEALVTEAVARASALSEDSAASEVAFRGELLGRVAVHAHFSHRDLAIDGALRVASAIPDGYDDYWGDYHATTADVLVMIAPHLGARLKDGVALAESIRLPQYRVRALAALLPFLPEEERRERLSDALRTARWKKKWRIEDHLPLLEYLPAKKRDVLCKQAVRKYQAGPDNIARLAPFLPARLWPKATRIILDRSELRETVAAGAMLPYAPDPYRDELVRKVLRKLPGFKAGESHETRRVLDSLAEHIPDHLVPEVIDALSVIGDRDARSEALARLAPYLAHQSMPAVLEIARQASPQHAAALLAAIAGRLAGSELEDALAIASGFEDVSCRATALTRLSVMLPEERRVRLLRAECARVRGSLRFKRGTPTTEQALQAVAELSEYLDEEDCVALARAVLHHWPLPSAKSLVTGEAIAALYPRLPASLASEVWSAVLALEYPAGVIREIAPCLEPDQVREALARTRELSAGSMAQAIRELAPYLSGDLFDADRTSLLKSLAPHVHVAGADNITSLAPELNPAERAEVLVALLPAFPRARVRAVCGVIVDLVQRAPSGHSRVVASPDRVVDQLLQAVPQVPEPERADVLSAAWRAASAAADLKTLEEVGRCLSRPLAVVAHDELTPKLDGPRPADPEPAISILDAALDRLTALERRLPSVPEAHRDHAVYIACLIHHDPIRLARELAEMSACLPADQASEIWSMVLGESQRITEPKTRLDVLLALAESAPVNVARPTVTAGIMAACDAAAANLSGDTNSQLDRAVRSIGTLPLGERHLLLSSVLSTSTARPRWVTLLILGRLAPAVAQISGEEGVATLVQAVRNVGHWWP